MLSKNRIFLNEDMKNVSNVGRETLEENAEEDELDFWSVISDQTESIRKHIALKSVDLMEQTAENNIENNQNSIIAEKHAMERKQVDAAIATGVAAAQASLKRVDQWNNS